MKRAITAAIALTWAFAGVAMADPPTASVPIEPAPTPIPPAPHVAPPPVAAPIPDARSLSQINPTAGPAVPPKKALKPSHPIVAAGAVEQRREVAALNDLAAAGYGQFHDMSRVGRTFEATVDDPRGNYVVTVNPDTGRITPPSAAADRETRALNVLVDHGYVQVNAIRPAGTGFIANVTRDGGPREVAVDPDSGRIAHAN
ncbi:MAG: hypothetical protein ACRED6_10450 [Stellaceae bacterium]